MVLDKIKKEIVKGILELSENNIDQIVLYGSVARGDNDTESDVDIAMIIKEPLQTQMRDRIIKWSAAIDLEYDIVLSLIDIEQEEYNKWKDVLPFYKNIEKEGVVLWKAA